MCVCVCVCANTLSYTQKHIYNNYKAVTLAPYVFMLGVCV